MKYTRDCFLKEYSDHMGIFPLKLPTEAVIQQAKIFSGSSPELKKKKK